MAPRKSVKAEVVEESGDSESEQESEYEIEEVLDAQKGLFPAVRDSVLAFVDVILIIHALLGTLWLSCLVERLRNRTQQLAG